MSCSADHRDTQDNSGFAGADRARARPPKGWWELQLQGTPPRISVGIGPHGVCRPKGR